MSLTSNMINMILTLSFFLRRRRLTLTDLALGSRVVLKNPCLITSDNSMQQILFSLKNLDDVRILQHAGLLLIIIQQSWHHFCAKSLHAQIFGIIFQTPSFLISCNHSNSQSTIAKYHLPYQFDVNFSPACGRPSAPGVIFLLLMLLFESLMLLKNTRVCVRVCVT